MSDTAISSPSEVEVPLKKVNHEQHYRAQISTAVEATGKNDDVHKGRPCPGGVPRRRRDFCASFLDVFVYEHEQTSNQKLPANQQQRIRN